MNQLKKVRLLAFFAISFFWLGSFAQTDTAKESLLATALYMMDGKQSTKEEVEKLDAKTIKMMRVYKGDDAIKKFGEKGNNGVVMVTTTAHSEWDAVFTKAQKQAYFSGSMDGWNNYLTANLKYPQAAKQNKIEGTARVQFLVDKEGNLYDMRLLEDPGYGIGIEAIRLLKEGPKWIPAEQNSRKVINRLVVPISFKL